MSDPKRAWGQFETFIAFIQLAVVAVAAYQFWGQWGAVMALGVVTGIYSMIHYATARTYVYKVHAEMLISDRTRGWRR